MREGVYVSQTKGKEGVYTVTYDIRIFQPNTKQMTPKAAHTLEHLLAVWFRNIYEGKDEVVYIGPMGCLTGFYLILSAPKPLGEVRDTIKRAFQWVIEQDTIPGATKEECGNYKLHSLPEAKGIARTFITKL